MPRKHPAKRHAYLRHIREGRRKTLSRIRVITTLSVDRRPLLAREVGREDVAPDPQINILDRPPAIMLPVPSVPAPLQKQAYPGRGVALCGHKLCVTYNGESHPHG